MLWYIAVWKDEDGIVRLFFLDIDNGWERGLK
jgi:hypothetical protein